MPAQINREIPRITYNGRKYSHPITTVIEISPRFYMFKVKSDRWPINSSQPINIERILLAVKVISQALTYPYIYDFHLPLSGVQPVDQAYAPPLTFQLSSESAITFSTTLRLAYVGKLFFSKRLHLRNLQSVYCKSFKPVPLQSIVCQSIKNGLTKN